MEVLPQRDIALLSHRLCKIEIAVSEHFLSNSHSVSHMLLITIETLRYERDCLRQAREVPLIHKAKTSESLRIKKRD